MSEDSVEYELDEPTEERVRISPTEHLIVTLARVLVSGTGTTDVATLLAIGHQLPAQVSPMCADLVEDALRQVWSTLAQRGGAVPTKLLANGTLTSGRVWQRHRPVALAFTPATIATLRWLVATPLTSIPVRGPALDAMPLALGDQVVIYLVLAALAPHTVAARAFAAQPLVQAAPLAWLGFPAELASTESPSVPSFDGLVAMPGAAVVEALAPELARRWSEGELVKRGATRAESMIAIGAAQDAVLAGFLQACHAARRRDLAGWVLDAAAPQLAQNLSPAPLRLDPAAPLGMRARARVAAGSLLRAVGHWTAWDQEHRGVRFFDDDYALAQFLLARFEVVGPVGAGRAAHWLHELNSLGMLEAT